MRHRHIAAAALALPGALLASPLAHADPCDAYGYGIPQGPVVAGLQEGDLGRGRRVCERTEFGVGGGGALIADLANFYGDLSAGLTLDGSLALGRGELFASFQAFRYELVLEDLAASAVGLGETALGGGYRFLATDRFTLGVNGKVVLPTAAGIYQNTWPFGWDVGLSGLVEVHPRVHLHGHAGVLASAAASKGPTQPRVGGVVTVGADLRPAPGFALVLDLHGDFGYTAPLDVLAGGIGLRFSDLERFGFEVGATLPLAGRDPTAVSLDLRASVLLGAYASPAPRVASR